MMRNASTFRPQRLLARLAPGSLVQLVDGSVWMMCRTRFMPAGWIIVKPLKPSALLALNGGRMPRRLVAVGEVAA